MGSYTAPLMDKETLGEIQQFMDEHFPGCQIDDERITECGYTDPHKEYDIWLKDNPIVHMITLSNGWTWEDPTVKPLSLYKVMLRGNFPSFFPEEGN